MPTRISGESVLVQPSFLKQLIFNLFHNTVVSG